MAKKELKSRFRLSKAGQEERDKKSKRRESKQVSTTAANTKKRIPKAPRMLSAAMISSNTTTPTNSQEASPDQNSNHVTNEAHQSPSIPRSPTHTFDPFSVLPIPSSPDLPLLFNLCKTPSPSLRLQSTDPSPQTNQPHPSTPWQQIPPSHGGRSYPTTQASYTLPLLHGRCMA